MEGPLPEGGRPPAALIADLGFTHALRVTVTEGVAGGVPIVGLLTATSWWLIVWQLPRGGCQDIVANL